MGQLNNGTTGQQDKGTMEQQDNKTTKQRDHRTTRQLDNGSTAHQQTEPPESPADRQFVRVTTNILCF